MAGRIVGIDLGTTNSLVGVIERGGPRLFAAEDGSPLVPSVLSLDENGAWLVGHEAKLRKSSHPQRTLFSVKRFVGRGRADIETIAGALPFNLSASDEQLVRFRVVDKTVTPIEASAKILQKLKQLAEAGLGEPVTRAVVTVPAYFDDAQRQATKLAGELAGLEVMRIVNEPTAACLAYGLDKRTLGTIAVFNLGGGTFDISILRVKDGVFEVLATHGDTALGGDDFDRAILEGLGVTPATAEERGRALVAAEALKKALTDAEEATFEGRVVTRAELERWIAPVLARATEPCRQCLADAGIDTGAITDVILVGGSTRTPSVRRFVQDLFRREPICTLDPDRVVAMGAAVQANILAGQTTGMLLLDVIPLSLGLETMGGVVSKLIHRNSTIPISASEQYSTYVDGQTTVDLHVVQGEREMVKDNRSLARFQLRGIPPLPAGVPKIDIEFIIDANGLLSVRAIELRTGTTASITVNPTFGLGDAQVEQMLSDSFENAESDFETRFLAEARVEADALVRAARKSLERGRQLVDKSEAEAIETATAALEAALAATDRKVIRGAIDHLNETTRTLAERLMNHAVSEALKNKTLTTEKRDGR